MLPLHQETVPLLAVAGQRPAQPHQTIQTLQRQQRFLFSRKRFIQAKEKRETCKETDDMFTLKCFGME